MTTEQVVLLDEVGRATGTAPKATVHGTTTPLHLAFSCHVLVDGQVLLTQRAAVKRTFPGVWTNAFCGHPAPGEPLRDAVVRRARQELGWALDPADLRLVLPTFGYRATADDGLEEHELCPVVVCEPSDRPVLDPDPAEVGGTAWVPWADLVAAAADPAWSGPGGGRLSPWCGWQVEALQAAALATGDPGTLPPALSW